MRILMKMKHGSHLYGTNTELSDTDYKGVYLPSIEDYLLQKVQKTITNNTGNNRSKNSSIDIDDQLFSLNYFLDLCINGDTYAIDTLHAPIGWEDTSSTIWEDIKSKRSLFYSKNLKSFVGYCRSQAAKYSMKGSRLETAKKFIEWSDDIINNNKKDGKKGHKIYCYPLEKIPTTEYSKVIIEEHSDEKPLSQNPINVSDSYIEIFDKKFYLTDYVESINKSMNIFYTSFGERAELARKNQNIDWKAIHHAFRAGYQLKEILETKDLKYPLRDREFLLDVKRGKLHWINDKIGDKLDLLVDEIKNLSDNSDFPDVCDRTYWDSWLCKVLKDEFL